jgi:steroid 5-alpha reductase family enzyme
MFKRNDVVNVAWGLGFIFIAWANLVLFQNFSIQNLLISLFVTVWGGRLSLHLGQRFFNEPEDFRFALLRKKWGKLFYIRSYFQIYMLHGVALILVALPILGTQTHGFYSLYWWNYIGVLLWLIGMFFQTVGDYQLQRFKKYRKTKNAVLNSGLWKYSRHPNYFGEVLLWWGIFLLALPVQNPLILLISPIVVTFFVIGFSGMPKMKKRWRFHKVYQKYAQKTSAFFPLPPRK